MSNTKPIMEGNKLIAEFMGAEELMDQIKVSSVGPTQIQLGKMLFKDRSPDFMHVCKITDLRYHSSWDWLMPVGKKIRDMLNAMHETMPKHSANQGDLIEVDIMCRLHEYDIEKTWQHIVQFIKWYNQFSMKEIDKVL